MFKIMKSGFYYTNPKRKKTIRPFNQLFKYNVTIKWPKNTIIILVICAHPPPSPTINVQFPTRLIRLHIFAHLSLRHFWYPSWMLILTFTNLSSGLLQLPLLVNLRVKVKVIPSSTQDRMLSRTRFSHIFLVHRAESFLLFIKGIYRWGKRFFMLV